MKYQLAYQSLRGARPTNQDRVAHAERDNAVLMVLADGLGGYRGGEIAAELLTQTVLRGFRAVKQPLIQQPSAFLALSIVQAHNAINDLGRAHPELKPRTTCVLCLVQNGYAYWAHVGDSRLYHFRKGQLLRRTQDHTTTEEWRREGLLSDEEVRHHPQKSRLLKCVGGADRPTISLGEETCLEYGDTLLLCSDGLWSAFTPEEMLEFLKRGPLEESVEDMLTAAERKQRATSDNVSAVCLRWEEAVTKIAPLQGNRAGDVDPRELWEYGKRVSAAQKQRKPASNDDRSSRDLAQDIRDLEDYLNKKIGPKR
ncbi:MAG: serine/threonine-protein phosphatase [Gammaproteobacteria bacterium]|nr:MAG: serine/threonine-protein phosphatase [Gammaproteobacteria bacterium]